MTRSLEWSNSSSDRSGEPDLADGNWPMIPSSLRHALTAPDADHFPASATTTPPTSPERRRGVSSPS